MGIPFGSSVKGGCLASDPVGLYAGGLGEDSSSESKILVMVGSNGQAASSEVSPWPGASPCSCDASLLLYAGGVEVATVDSPESDAATPAPPSGVELGVGVSILY